MPSMLNTELVRYVRDPPNHIPIADPKDLDYYRAIAALQRCLSFAVKPICSLVPAAQLDVRTAQIRDGVSRFVSGDFPMQIILCFVL